MKKYNLLPILVFATLLILMGCGSKMYRATPDSNSYNFDRNQTEGYTTKFEEPLEKGRMYLTSDKDETDNVIWRAGNPKYSERKKIYTADLTLIIENSIAASKELETIAKQFGGHVQSQSDYTTTIHVNSEKLNEALAAIEDLGEIKYKDVDAQDVTDLYLDYEIRLDNALKSRDRYLALLNKAENVSAALQVEKELERLNEVIDLYKGRMNRLNYFSAYSEITVDLQEKKKLGIVGAVGFGVYKVVKWLFIRN